MLKYEVGGKIELSLKKDTLTKSSVKKYISELHVYNGLISDHPKISVQIVAYNEGGDLLQCLNSFSNQTLKNYEIILVDNGLDEQTKKDLKRYQLTHIVTTANLGCTHGRNVGAPYSKADLTVFVDADGIVDEDYLENCLRAMEDDSLVAVRGKVLGLDGDATTAAHYDLGDEIIPSIISTEGNSVWRTKDYLKVGGFENSLAGGEGLVLCYRMHEIYGYEKKAFGYNPKVILHHDFHSNDSHLRNKMRKYALTRDAIEKRYPLINAFNSSYSKFSKKRHFRPNAKLAHYSELEKKIVRKQYMKLYEKNAKERMENPTLIKDQGKFDFSVIIPCYNLGDLVWKAVNSVLLQSINSVQIIIVDDASPDPETRKILKELEEYVEVVYLQKNGGVAAARNAGIKHAKSDYILCLDADDTIRPTYLEKAKNLFEMDESAGIVSCGAQYFGGKSGVWNPKDKIGLVETLVGSPIPTASCFRKSAWKESGGYDAKLRGYEDWSYWINLIKRGWQVRVIPEILFDYYVRPDGKVNTSNKNSVNLVSRIVESHKDVFEDNYAKIIAEKHHQITTLRADIERLKKSSIRRAIMSTPLAPMLKFVKRAATQDYKNIKELLKSHDYKMLFKVVSHKFMDQIYRLYRKLFV